MSSGIEKDKMEVLAVALGLGVNDHARMTTQKVEFGDLDRLQVFQVGSSKTIEEMLKELIEQLNRDYSQK